MFDVYLYGMALKTTSFLLEGYPKGDDYQEIKAHYEFPGGETGTCATVLASLGCKVKMDGNFAGTHTYPLFQSFYGERGVDISSMHYDENYEGLQDYVLIAGDTRAPMGTFGAFYSGPKGRWNVPKAQDISNARVAGIDPYFREESEKAAALCLEYKVPYVTIDCAGDSFVGKNSAVNIISKEFFKFSGQEDADEEALFEKYIGSAGGLVIFTHGARPLWYGRKGQPRKEFSPFPIKPVSTLGAGDTFKAGAVYALLKGMDDDSLVRFASACAAVACTRFPLPLNPPKLEEVAQLTRNI